MKAKPSAKGKGVVLEVGPQDASLEKSAALPFMIKNILVPLDFSEASKKALLYASRFAEAFGASLAVLHVVEIPVTSGMGEAGVVLTDPVTIRNLQASAQSQAERMVQSVVPRAAGATVTSRAGVPFREIIETAKDDGHDLIIISTHGRTGLKRLFMGSTAERVVRHAPCPVLVVREHEVDFLEGA